METLAIILEFIAAWLNLGVRLVLGWYIISAVLRLRKKLAELLVTRHRSDNEVMQIHVIIAALAIGISVVLTLESKL